MRSLAASAAPAVDRFRVGGGAGCGRVAGVFAGVMGLFVALVLCLGAGVAQAAPKGVVDVFGAAGSGSGEFQVAAGVAVNETTGAVYVVDVGNQRVQVFDADGGFTSAFGVGGAGDGEFAFRSFTVTGVAVDQSDGSVYVADIDNNRVQKLDAAGGYLDQFGSTASTPGSGDGEMSGPQGVAVDPVSGDVYVLDAGNSRVQRFDDTGSYISQFGIAGGGDGEFTSASSIAVDLTGSVYVVDQGPFFTGRVQRFDDTGVFVEQLAPGVLTNSPHQVAADSTTGHILVSQFAPDFSHLQVVELDATGTVIDTHTAAGFATGLASNPASGAIYLADGFSHRVFILGTVNPADAATTAATDIEAHTAMLHGSVDPNGSPTQYRFEYSTDGNTWTPAPQTDVEVGNGTDPILVSQPTGPLEANTEYRYRIVATKTYGGAPPTTSNETTFTTQPAPPSVTATGATPTTDGATLRGRINPQNSPTTYRFEYGPTTAYGTTIPIPDGDAGAGTDPVAVSEQITSLQPDTTYHYRLVATNQAATTNSPDRTLTTPTTDLPDPPAGRGYELVSPPNKNGGNILDLNSRVAPNGNAISYGSAEAFAGAQAAPLRNDYIARRGPNGWTTKPVLPAHGITSSAQPVFHQLTSEDLSRSVVTVEEFTGPGSVAPLDPGAPLTCGFGADSPCNNNYVQDNVNGGWSLLTPGPHKLTPFSEIATATSDFGHVLFESEGVQAPGAPDTGGFKLYEWDHGTIRYVGVAPDGSPFPSSTAGDFLLDGPTKDSNRVKSRPLSDDGRRIYFLGSDEASTYQLPGGLYLREDGTKTYWVSESEHSSPGSAQDATFLLASRDGSRALFTTRERLVDEDTNDTSDLYLYTHSADPENDRNLTLVSLDREPADGQAAVVDPFAHPFSPSAGGVVGGSDDLGRFYFVSVGQIVPGEVTAPERKLYLWDHGHVTFISGVVLDDIEMWNIATDVEAPVQLVTPDGEHLVFTSSQPLTPVDTDTDRDVYRYDSGSDELLCISCHGTTASAGASRLRDIALNGSFFRVPARNVSDDGGRVFFESRDALVPDDGNGQVDVYMWEDGRLELISSGTGNRASRFVGATPSGDDVFFLTSERLVGWDIDGAVDLYDARVGGGFPEPELEDGCGLDCQGEPSGAPAPRGAGSGAFRGRGDAVGGPRARLSVGRLSRAQRARLARGLRAALAVRVNRPGIVSATARAKLDGRRVVVARAVKRARRAQTVRLSLRLSQPARRALARGSVLRLSLSVVFGGQRDSRTLALDLGKGR
jgi:DNA-binding beta-propeller fold protein YncE